MFSRKGAKPQRKPAFRFPLGAFAPLREALIQTNPLPREQVRKGATPSFFKQTRGRAALAPFLTVLHFQSVVELQMLLP
jgi:hypothetical protein